MREGQYFRFCFDHERHYNNGYNYFSGMRDGAVARFEKRALTGHRPTWHLGRASFGSRAAGEFAPRRAGTRMHDPFNLFGDKTEVKALRLRKVRTLEGKPLEKLGSSRPRPPTPSRRATGNP
jgi:hypothetical protein